MTNDKTYNIRLISEFRQDDVAGGLLAAQHECAYVGADGLHLPTKRRAFMRGSDDRTIPEQLIVSIDLREIEELSERNFGKTLLSMSASPSLMDKGGRWRLLRSSTSYRH